MVLDARKGSRVAWGVPRRTEYRTDPSPRANAVEWRHNGPDVHECLCAGVVVGKVQRVPGESRRVWVSLPLGGEAGPGEPLRKAKARLSMSARARALLATLLPTFPGAPPVDVLDLGPTTEPAGGAPPAGRPDPSVPVLDLGLGRAPRKT
jgi:hypothetical protein